MSRVFYPCANGAPIHFSLSPSLRYNRLGCSVTCYSRIIFLLKWVRAKVRNEESLITRLYSVRSWWWSVAREATGESAVVCGHCMNVWSVVVQRELNLVVMEWTAAITGDHVGLFWDFGELSSICWCWCYHFQPILMYLGDDGILLVKLPLKWDHKYHTELKIFTTCKRCSLSVPVNVRFSVELRALDTYAGKQLS